MPEESDVQPSASTSADDTQPIAVDRVEDKGEHTILEFGQPPAKQMGFSEARPSVPNVIVRAFPRNGSLLDPDDGGSEILASEASSHLDESYDAELLAQVRNALRGESSMNSLNEESRSDVNDGSLPPSARNLGLDPSNRSGMLAANVNND